MDSENLYIQQLEEFLKDTDIDYLLQNIPTPATTTTTTTNTAPAASSTTLETTLQSIINNTSAAVTSPNTIVSNLVQTNEDGNSFSDSSSQHSVEASDSTLPNNTTPSPPNLPSERRRRRRKHWQDWKDEMTQHLSKRTEEDPNFKIKACAKPPIKPKPYDKYTTHYKLE